MPCIFLCVLNVTFSTTIESSLSCTFHVARLWMSNFPRAGYFCFAVPYKHIVVTLHIKCPVVIKRIRYIAGMNSGWASQARENESFKASGHTLDFFESMNVQHIVLILFVTWWRFIISFDFYIHNDLQMTFPAKSLILKIVQCLSKKCVYTNIMAQSHLTVYEKPWIDVQRMKNNSIWRCFV